MAALVILLVKLTSKNLASLDSAWPKIGSKRSSFKSSFHSKLEFVKHCIAMTFFGLQKFRTWLKIVVFGVFCDSASRFSPFVKNEINKLKSKVVREKTHIILKVKTSEAWYKATRSSTKQFCLTLWSIYRNSSNSSRPWILSAPVGWTGE